MRRAIPLFPLAIFFLAFVVGCGGGGGSDSSTGTLDLSMVDAPFPVTDDCLKAANIIVDRVEIQGHGGFEAIPLVDAVDGKVQLNLLELVGGLDQRLAIGELPTGRYHQIRLHLVEAKLVFHDDTEQVFKIPSGSQSGLKINVEPHVVIAAGQTAHLQLDFDLAESFHVTGTGGDPTCDDLKDGENKVIFNPVVHACNLDESGVVSGTVSREAIPLSGVLVEVFVAEQVIDDTTAPVATTFSSPSGLENVAEGEYALRVAPGTYDLYVQAPDAASRTLAAKDVVVVQGQIKVQDLSVPSP